MVSYSSLCIYWKWPVSLRKFQVISVLAAGFLIHLSLGSLYTYGNLVPYIVSYIRDRSHPTSLRYTDATFILAAQIAGQGTSMALGGWLEKKFGPRLVSLFGGWFMSLGVLLSYITIKVSFWLLLITYGFMFGLGIGIAYIGPVACAMRWIPKWKGIASGVVVSGFGLSALLFNAIETGYINPYNDTPITNDTTNEKYFNDKALLDRVPYIFLIMGGCFAVMQFVGCIFVVNPPLTEDNRNSYRPLPDNDLYSNDERERSDSEESITLHKYARPSSPIQQESLVRNNKSFTDSSRSSIVSTNSVKRSHRRQLSSSSVVSDLEQSTVSWSSNFIYKVSPFELLKKPNFYILWIMFFCVGISTSFINSLYKSYGLAEVTTDDHFLTIIGGVSAVFNLLGRLLWGALADLTSYKLAFVLQGALSSVLLLTFYITSIGGKYMLLIWVCGVFFCVGGYFSLFPTAIARSFGQENLSINYGLLFTAQIAGGVMAGFLSLSLVSKVHWYGLFLIMAGLNIVEYLLALFYRHKRYIKLRHPDDLHENASRIEENSIKFPENDNSSNNGHFK